MPGQGASNGHPAALAFQRDRARRRSSPARPLGRVAIAAASAARTIACAAERSRLRWRARRLLRPQTSRPVGGVGRREGGRALSTPENQCSPGYRRDHRRGPEPDRCRASWRCQWLRHVVGSSGVTRTSGIGPAMLLLPGQQRRRVPARRDLTPPNRRDVPVHPQIGIAQLGGQLKASAWDAGRA